MDQELFYSCLTTIFSTGDCVIFHHDEDSPGKKGAICNPNRNEYPDPGTYIPLAPGIHLMFIMAYFTSLMYCRW